MSNKSKTSQKPFQCDKCGRGFKAKHHLDKHLNRKTPCNKVYKCSDCGKVFPNASELKRHENRVTPCAPESIPVIKGSNAENRCHMCGNEYSNAYNLKRHQKSCSVMKDPSLLLRMFNDQREMIKTQQQMIQTLVSGSPQPQTIINGDVNIQNTIENNLYVNVTICSFGKEDLSRLDTSKVMNLLKGQIKDFMPKMIEHVHANPEMPEFHNVFYDPEREKAIVFAPSSDNTNTWQAHDFSDISAQLTEKIKEHIRPGNGPYFDMAMKDKDTETSNKIIMIANEERYDTPEAVEQQKDSLTNVTKNKDFMSLVEVVE
jgi:hypothetical protein